MKPSAWIRAALPSGALAIGATAAALLAAELLLRGGAWLLEKPPAPVDPELAALPEIRSFLELAGPNVRGLHDGVLWRTNSAGFRGPEVSPLPPPGVFRIAVVGDSFAAGMGVPEEDAYAAQLERLLHRSGAPMRFEVLNFGLGGLDIDQVLRRAVRRAAAFHPHLYVYGFTVNDIERHDEAEQSGEAQGRRLAEEMLRFADSRSYLLRTLWPRWISLRQMLFPRPDEDYAGSLAGAYRDPEKFARIERGLDGFARLAAQSGACVHVLIHTDLAHLRFGHPFGDAYDRVEGAARARGLSVTQSFPAYRWRDSGSLRVSVLDGHPNAEGHRILAEALYAGLRDLPPRCGFPALP